MLMPYFEMHDEMLLSRLDFLQTKTRFLGSKPGDIHGKNLGIPMNLRLTREHGETIVTGGMPDYHASDCSL